MEVTDRLQASLNAGEKGFYRDAEIGAYVRKRVLNIAFKAVKGPKGWMVLTK